MLLFYQNFKRVEIVDLVRVIFLPSQNPLLTLSNILLTWMDLYLVSRPLSRELPVGQIFSSSCTKSVVWCHGARFLNTYQRLHQFWTNRPRAWFYGKWDINNGTELILSFCLNFWESESCLLFPPWPPLISPVLIVSVSSPAASTWWWGCGATWRRPRWWSGWGRAGALKVGVQLWRRWWPGSWLCWWWLWSFSWCWCQGVKGRSPDGRCPTLEALPEGWRRINVRKINGLRAKYYIAPSGIRWL